MAIEVIKPPHAICKNFYRESVKVFLAGSIEMGKAENWQDKVEKYCRATTPSSDSYNFKDVHVTLFNPRRDKWNPDWKQSVEQPQFYQQVNWELNALDKSDIILMYFDSNTKSPISLLELGLYASSGKLLVCCPDGFWRKGNVEIICEKYGIPLFDELQSLLNGMKLKVNKIKDGRSIIK